MLTSFAGARLFGESYGRGSPSVLALHGWARDHSDFSATLTVPSELDAIALDLPGFGATPAPESAWGSAEYAEALVPLLEEMSAQVVVIGHSFGGRVAVHLAARAPERIGGMVLSAVPLFRPAAAPARSPLGYRVVRQMARRRLVGEKRLEEARQRYGSADYRAASGVVRDILVRTVAERYDVQLAAVSCPVELVWGDRDTETPVSVAERVRDTLAVPARLTVCAGVGHLTPLAAPEALRQAIERLRR